MKKIVGSSWLITDSGRCWFHCYHPQLTCALCSWRWASKKITNVRRLYSSRKLFSTFQYVSVSDRHESYVQDSEQHFRSIFVIFADTGLSWPPGILLQTRSSFQRFLKPVTADRHQALQTTCSNAHSWVFEHLLPLLIQQFTNAKLWKKAISVFPALKSGFPVAISESHLKETCTLGG